MDVTWQQLAMIYEGLFILMFIYAFREFIISKIYGVKFKRWLILDTGESGYSILNKSLNEWKIQGQKRSVSYSNLLRGWAFYTHDNAENLKMVKPESDDSKWTYYCNTDEYNSNTQTRIFQMLLFVLEKNYILIILGLVVLSIAVTGYGIYLNNQQQSYLEYIAWRVNQTVVQHGGDITNVR